MNYPFAMLTDLYQLTMAEGYWKLGKHQQKAVFDLFFREHPFRGGYTIFCGLESVLNMISEFRFSQKDIDYLATLKSKEGSPLFDRNFLKALLDLRLSVNINSVLEGSLVFPKEPLLRVEGPLWECQLLETVLLNLINFPSLIATKASRICLAALGDPVMEFGLRRAQGPDGGLTASRAAFVGGAGSTSNVLAGLTFGIPVVGTHAHSWVMAFDDERSALQSFAKVMPHNCTLLVDTYNTLEGVKHAIEVGLKLKKEGHALLGIRLDSGDLAQLSIAARDLLDAAGLQETVIMASSDLDEYRIADLKSKGAKITLWGVGTRLVTGFDQPALGAVYKLVAIQNDKKQWINKAKKTDDILKQSLAGIYNLRRFTQNNVFVRDVMYFSGHAPSPEKGETFEELLQPVVDQGKIIYQSPSLPLIQKRVQEQLEKIPGSIKVFSPTVSYPVVIQGQA